MSTITTIQSTDIVGDSRAVINTNFSNLNTDKAELNSPTFTGTPILPTGTTAVTQGSGDNSTKIATTEYVDTNAGTAITIETTAGSTHSLTTTANQKVIVWAKGSISGDANTKTAILKYNTVQKDAVSMDDGDSFQSPFALMYTETPGAGTQNITVEASGGGSLSLFSGLVILVMKIG